MEIEFIKSTKT
jgi:hypothetical protein